MPETPLRNRSISLLSFFVAVGAVIIGIVLVIVGLVPSAIAGRAVLIVGGLILIAVSLMMHAIVKLLVFTEANINRVHNNTLDLHDAARRIEPLIKMIADNSQLSDAARSITHRDMELEALRHVLREEMFQGNWDAAMYLIEQMQTRFGYAREAEALRKELAQIREMTIEEKIGEAIAHIEKLMDEHQWERARQESERLMKLFPRHERILGLPAELNRRREARKQELLQLWNQAVQREEVDRGIQILTELDPFLSKEEAQTSAGFRPTRLQGSPGGPRGQLRSGRVRGQVARRPGGRPEHSPGIPQQPNGPGSGREARYPPRSGRFCGGSRGHPAAGATSRRSLLCFSPFSTAARHAKRAGGSWLRLVFRVHSVDRHASDPAADQGGDLVGDRASEPGQGLNAVGRKTDHRQSR